MTMFGIMHITALLSYLLISNVELIDVAMVDCLYKSLSCNVYNYTGKAVALEQ